MIENPQQNRDGFSSKWGFILACIGSAVGMGNIWRFPIMVSVYGGLTFLIPYFLFVILIASTGVVAEMALGRSAGTGPVGAFGKCTQLRFGNKTIGEVIGIIPVLGSLALAIGYTCVLAWIFKYTYLALSGALYAMRQNMEVISGTFDVTARAGGANLWILVTILVSFIIMSMGISGGIEKANKIMMPILFFLLLALGIYVLTLSGSHNGYKYIFTLDISGLANPKVWLFAFGQAFFSLSVAGSGTVIYGSYLSKEEDLPSAAWTVAMFDTIAALLAAFVIIPAMASANAPLDQGGPGLMFIYLVNILNGIAAGKIIGLIFYVCVLFAGVSSIINLYETPIAYLQDKFGIKRIAATGVIHIIGCVAAIFIQAIVSGWMDFVSIYVCPLGALFAAVMFLWIAKKEYVLEAVNAGAKKPIGKIFYPLAKYVYAAVALVALIAGAILGGIG